MTRLAKHFEPVATVAVAAAFGVVVFMAAAPSMAQQQQTCGQRGEMELALANRFGERPFSTATAGHNLVKFYVNPSTRSWTAIAVTPDGGACIFAAGNDFEPASKSDAKKLGPSS
jgi:hypothetical protein